MSFPEQWRENSSQDGGDGRGPSSHQKLCTGTGKDPWMCDLGKGQCPELALVFRTWERMEEQRVMVKNPEVSWSSRRRPLASIAWGAAGHLLGTMLVPAICQ